MDRLDLNGDRLRFRQHQSLSNMPLVFKVTVTNRTNLRNFINVQHTVLSPAHYNLYYRVIASQLVKLRMMVVIVNRELESHNMFLPGECTY